MPDVAVASVGDEGVPQYTRESRDDARAGGEPGLYNGFLAAGVAWAVVSSQRDVALFFPGCVVVAGLYGMATVSRRIFHVQAVPALAAIAAVLLTGLP